MKQIAPMALAALALVLSQGVANAVTFDATFEAWVRNDGATLGERDNDLVSVWSSEASGGARWGVVEFDLSTLSGTTVSDVNLGLWSQIFDASDDDFPIKQNAAIIAVPGASSDLDWAAITTLAQSPLETLGAYELPHVVGNPQIQDTFLYSAGSTADVANIQSVVDGGGKLTLVLMAVEDETQYRGSWGDGAYAGMKPVLYINEAPPETAFLTLEIDSASGDMQIVNPGVTTTFDIDGYVISSAAGSLNPAAWTSLTDNPNHPGWQEVQPSSNSFSELNLTDSTQLLGGDVLDLGAAFSIGGAEDVVFEYNAAGAGPKFGLVKYVTPTSDLDGDFNEDGTVDGADFLKWQRGPNPTAGDLALWRNNFGETSLASGGQVAGVPEPASFSLVVFAACLGTASRRRWGAAKGIAEQRQ